MKSVISFFFLIVFAITLNAQTAESTGKDTSVTEKSMDKNQVVEKSKINGVWTGKVANPQGDMDLTFTFIVDGKKLSGKNASAMGEIELTNGVVNGNDFSFDVDLQGMIIKHNCKYLDDDSIDVKADMMGQEIVMKLIRVTK